MSEIKNKMKSNGTHWKNDDNVYKSGFEIKFNSLDLDRIEFNSEKLTNVAYECSIPRK